MTSDSTVIPLRQPDEIDDPLTAVLRSGARRLLAQAVEAEAEAFLAAMRGVQLPDGRERVVRHGHGPERLVQTGIGPVEVQRVKLRDRGAGQAGADRIRFTSAILPRWARRTRSVEPRGSPDLDALLPVLYLRGVSMGDFQDALGALLGKDAPNLSPSVIARLRDEWQADYARWERRDLSARRYVYVWADGVYLQARMEPQAECMLVLIGATPEGKKELLGFQVGVRESAQSWRELLVDLKARGLAIAPELATAVRPKLRSHLRGRRARLLEGARGGIADDTAPALHSPQDGQRIGQATPIGPARRQARPARDLGGAGSRDGGGGGRDVRPEVWGQVREGGHLLGEGPRCPADVLRLPCRALGPSTYVQPDRERVRHGEAPHRAHEGRAVAGHRSAHGVQAGHGRRQDMAQAKRREPVAQGRPGRHLPRRRRGHRHASTARRLDQPPLSGPGKILVQNSGGRLMGPGRTGVAGRHRRTRHDDLRRGWPVVQG